MADIIGARYRDLLDTLVVLRPVVSEPTPRRITSSRLTPLRRARRRHARRGMESVADARKEEAHRGEKGRVRKTEREGEGF